VKVHFAHQAHMANICGESMAVQGRKRGVENAGRPGWTVTNLSTTAPGPEADLPL
jgi:hypothetical protein